VFAREIAAVIDIEHVGDTADGPSRIAFPPDRVPERKTGVKDRRSAEKHHDARDGARIMNLLCLSWHSRDEIRSHGKIS
jgi:hypothetical protein